MNDQRRLCVFLALFLMPASFVAAAEMNVDPRAWDELDIVPMPKELHFTDRNLDLTGGGGIVLVVGRNKCRKSEIGAEWINKKLTGMGQAPLAVVDDSTILPGKTGIVIGTRRDNPLIEQAAKASVVDVAPGNPGERGYEIRTSKDGKRIFLAGADPIGALYACVTFAELIEESDGGARWRGVAIRDWPEVINTSFTGPYAGTSAMPELMRLVKDVLRRDEVTPEKRSKFLAAYNEWFDWLLRRKVTLWNHYLYGNSYDFKVTRGIEVLREAIDYGRERGIDAFIYAENPFVGLREDHPELAGDALPEDERYGRWIRSWGMDDLRRDRAERLADFYHAAGFRHIGFHDTDTGALDNPAQWGQRSEADRKRWGDDYVAATVHKHMIYYDAIKKLAPDTKVHITIYPYGLATLLPETCLEYVRDRYGAGPAAGELADKYLKQYTTFWQRMGKGFPSDISICYREIGEENVKVWRKLIGEDRPVFSWYALMSHYWGGFFSEAPRWTRTFVRQPDDFVFPQYGDQLIPLQSLSVREYAWNLDMPDAAPFAKRPGEEQWKHQEPQGFIYEKVLPRICRNLFGREAGAAIAFAASRNVCPKQIFATTRPSMLLLKTSERMQWQADNAAAGREALDPLWAKHLETGTRFGMDDWAFRRFIHVREVLAVCEIGAALKAKILLARERAVEQDPGGAKAALDEADRILSGALSRLERMVAERPEDPVLQQKDFNRWSGMWREFMADQVDLEPLRETVAQTRKEILTLGTIGGVPKLVLDNLKKHRVVYAARASDGMIIDGRLDEPGWRTAPPAECFFALGSSGRVARADTRVRVLFTEQNLYAGFEAWTPDDHVRDKDTVELFLKTIPGDPYIHFLVGADGSVRMQRSAMDGPRYRRDETWVAEGFEAKVERRTGGYTVEMKVPRHNITTEGPETTAAQALLVNLTRSWPAADASEHSSIQAPGVKDFHDIKAFPRLVLETVPLETWIDVTADGFGVKVITLPDTVASVASFRLAARANRVLHNVSVQAEAYDGNGRLHRTKNFEGPKLLMYEWESREEASVEFEQSVKQGGVKLTLQADEGQMTRWYRFGGWMGNDKLGVPFAEGVSGRAVTEPCFFSSYVSLSDGTLAPLFEERRGTVEFWVRPAWTAAWPVNSRNSLVQPFRRAWIHYGPNRPADPRHDNNSPLTIQALHFYGNANATMRTVRHRGGWASTARMRDDGRWQAGTWRHLAMVWDDEPSDREDWIRIYVDGKRAGGLYAVESEDRMEGKPNVRMDTDSHLPIQLGCMNSGWLPADSAIDELRISRTARYTDDFTPLRDALVLDRDTAALFHFDGDLNGEGMTSRGEAYTIEVAPGVVGCQ